MSINKGQLIHPETAEIYICNICQRVLDQPTIVCPQAHVFCLACVEPLSECPTCSSPINSVDDLSLSEGYTRMIEGLRVTCKERTQGCDWTGIIADESDHRLNECQYRIESCPNQPCSETFSIADKANRVLNCSYKRISCPNSCGTIVSIQDLPQHKEFCSKQKTTCPRGTCGSKYNRDRAQYHEAKCSFWSCPNSKYGCPTLGTKEAQAVHLPYCSSLSQQIAVLQSNIAALKHNRDMSLMTLTAESNKRYSALIEEFEQRTATYRLEYSILKTKEEEAVGEVLRLREQLSIEDPLAEESKEESRAESKEEVSRELGTESKASSSNGDWNEVKRRSFEESENQFFANQLRGIVSDESRKRLKLETKEEN